MLREREAEAGRPFDVVLRLRADMLWEARVSLPSPLPPRTLFVPWIEPNTGHKDHVAFGDRQAMEVYLTRGALLGDDSIWGEYTCPLPYAYSERVKQLVVVGRNGRPRVTSEQFLRAVLYRAGVSVVPLKEWTYCLFTRRALIDQHGGYGCIARARARTRCGSLVCYRENIKYWCNCYNTSCAALRAGDTDTRLGPLEAKPGGGGYYSSSKARMILSRGLNTRHAMCVDVRSSQLLLRAGGMGATACKWSLGELRSRYWSYSYVERAANCSVVRRIPLMNEFVDQNTTG